MKLDFKTIFSIIVVVLFVVSIFAFAFVGTNRTTSKSQTTNSDSNSENAAITAYNAKVTAKVSEIYPQLIVVSDTNEFDNTKISDTLKAIDGIKKASVQFTQDQSGKVILMSRLIFDITKKNEVISTLQSLSQLNNPEIYQNAMVLLNDNNLNLINDKNVTKEYDLTDNRLEGIINLNTEIDDNIEASLQVVFRGELPVQFIVVESTNLSANPQIIVADANLPVANWGTTIKITATSGIESYLDENQIKEIIGDEDTNVTTSYTGALKYQLDSNISVTQDLNNYLQSLIDQNILADKSTDKNTVSLYFKDDFNRLEYPSIKNHLADSFLLDYSRQLSELLVNYTLLSDSNNLNFEDINAELKEKQTNVTAVQKSAVFDISKVELNGKTYYYDDNTISVWVNYPKDLIDNNLVDITLQAYSSRNKILFAIGSEK